MKNKRLIISIVTGAVLGIFCIIGLSIRHGFFENELFMLATWVNRVLIGLMIGLLPRIKKNTKLVLLRGALFGFFVSGSFYLATAFRDTPGYFMGILYGVIIDYVATKYEK
ncbi:MAG: hypothetical protein ABIH82_01060 [Candidatus Woesearchaeota archaeon]